jgi:hypothetical protein
MNVFRPLLKAVRIVILRLAAGLQLAVFSEARRYGKRAGETKKGGCLCLYYHLKRGFAKRPVLLFKKKC